MKQINWHRLFGITLTDYFTDTAYTVELEKDLSLKKQFLDVVIVEKNEGQMPDEIADGLEDMAAHNLLSYKSFRESFDDWSADELVGHYVNYRKQVGHSQKQLLPKKDFRLYAVCTRFPEKLAKEAVLTSVTDGVYDLRWGIRDIRIIVTSQTAREKRNAMWLMFSAVSDSVRYGVSRYRGKLKQMSTAICRLLVKYQTERIIDMPYTLEDFRRDNVKEALGYMTPEEILAKFPHDELLKKIPPKERLKGLSTDEIFGAFPAEERLRGLSPEDVFKAFSSEQIEAYLKKLRKKGKSKKKV